MHTFMHDCALNSFSEMTKMDLDAFGAVDFYSGSVGMMHIIHNANTASVIVVSKIC